MKCIIGLGNPDLRYRSTKHNVGANVIKKIAAENSIRINKNAYSSLIGKGKVSGEDVIFVFPQTYMNLSGQAVKDIFMNEMKDIKDLLVVCDDINLKLGRVRLRKKGSSGGHKGLESIIRELARDDFARLRVGIATDVHKGDITNYVLTPFKRHEMRNAAHAITLARDAAVCWIEEGIESAMAEFNKKKAGTS
ncbi:MAG: aminoacyl-tRNA hydrolase [Candidatus Omnitrophota bacterium]